MGLGKSMKETTLHHFRDPLLDVVASDPEVNLRGVILVGSPDDGTQKHFVSTRAAQLVGGMGVSGVILSCNGIGNNHVDYANTIDEIEKLGIPACALSLCPAHDFVVQNDSLNKSVLNFYQNYEDTAGALTNILAEHTVTALTARKALSFLKLRMKKSRSTT